MGAETWGKTERAAKCGEGAPTANVSKRMFHPVNRIPGERDGTFIATVFACGD
jgi:hypothetical protein